MQIFSKLYSIKGTIIVKLVLVHTYTHNMHQNLLFSYDIFIDSLAKFSH